MKIDFDEATFKRVGRAKASGEWLKINCTVTNCADSPLHISTGADYHLGFVDKAEYSPFYFSIRRNGKPYEYQRGLRHFSPDDLTPDSISLKKGESYTYTRLLLNMVYLHFDKGTYEIIWKLNTPPYLGELNKPIKHEQQSNKITLVIY